MHIRASKKNVSVDVSSKKCKKKGRQTSRVKRRVNRKIDIISDLPEHVLHQILYHLHRKDAARTCILSKWRQVWNSYQVVDLDLCRFRNKKKALKENYKNQMINRLLNNGDEQMHSIHKFRLCFNWETKMSEVNDWIVSSIERNVRELEVHAKNAPYQYHRLPFCVMHESSITALSLCCCVIPTYTVNLPHLQKLSFKNECLPAAVQRSDL